MQLHRVLHSYIIACSQAAMLLIVPIEALNFFIVVVEYSFN